MIPGYRDFGKGRKVVDINRRVILTHELGDDDLAAIMSAEPGKRSRRLNYLMADPLIVGCPKCSVRTGQTCLHADRLKLGAHVARFKRALKEIE